MSSSKRQSGHGNARAKNRVRIIGGAWRSRLIEFPDSPGLRPTPDRGRETLFNWLGQSLAGKRCLDRFAGIGVLAFEAASRGATSVVMIESAKSVVEALRQNQLRLAATQCQIVAQDAVKTLGNLPGKFDIVFIDPPFTTDLMPMILGMVGSRLTENGLVYAEWRESLAGVIAEYPDQGWRVQRQGKAGAVHFALLSKEQIPSTSDEVAS